MTHSHYPPISTIHGTASTQNRMILIIIMATVRPGYVYPSTEASCEGSHDSILYLEKSSYASVWKRRFTMYRVAAPSLILLIVVLYSLYATAVLMKTEHILHSQQNSVLQEKQAYLQRMKELYSSVAQLYNSTIDPNTIVRRLTIMGVVAELLGLESSPIRTLMPYMRGNQIVQERSDGSFESIVTVDPPYKGEQCFNIRGTVDYTFLSGIVTSIQPVECSERPDSWSNTFILEPTAGVDAIKSYSNGSKGINELMNLGDRVECTKNSKDECGRGTVIMDDWLNKTLTFQRKLAVNVTLDKQQFLGTHNSFNDKADGYGDGDSFLNNLLKLVSAGHWEFVWAQQYFSMTDQLNLGSRYLMLDPVYIFGAMRLCHCGTTFKWVDKVVDWLEEVLHTKFDFDSGDLGCLPDDRKFEDGIREVYDWVIAPGHEKEVVMIMINDFAKDHDWGHISLIHQPIRDFFGDIVFTPNDKEKYFPNRWPTSQELIDLKKRVVVIGSDRCANVSLIFTDMTGPPWDQDSMKYFTPFPDCSSNMYKPGQWYVVGGESQLIGPIYNGPEEEGLITSENMPYLLQCPVTILKIDLISPGLLSGGVWSWAQGYSVSNMTSAQCAAMSIPDVGRWVTLPCSTDLHYACQNGSNVILSTATGPWNNKNACPTGFTFYLPRTGYENWQLYQYISNVTNRESLQIKSVWLNLPFNIF